MGARSFCAIRTYLHEIGAKLGGPEKSEVGGQRPSATARPDGGRTGRGL